MPCLTLGTRGCRFIVGVLSDFDLVKDAVSYNDMGELDRYMLHIISEFARALSLLSSLFSSLPPTLLALTTTFCAGSVTEHYESYSYLRVHQAISNLVTLDLSSFYFEVVKVEETHAHIRTHLHSLTARRTITTRIGCMWTGVRAGAGAQHRQ
jgi:isoleucyl-tRNA synthetase